ncbi:HK97 gp10 family phage protein [Pseudomonas sp. NPDC090202]|uniref:HK97 gp10 family phage protein n=1 Tax=Pseudomonas sp. NPDC090202 TaxID=3364476 RepID=UPI003807D56B
MGGWSNPPGLFADQVENDLVEHQKQIVIDLVDEITSNAPIDTGQYMANNIVSIGSPDYSVRNDYDTLGTATRGTAKAALSSLKPFSLVYIQNNVDYGETIEFGGYNGPSLKVTDAGYSRMAPKGVYGLSFIAVTEALK